MSYNIFSSSLPMPSTTLTVLVLSVLREPRLSRKSAYNDGKFPFSFGVILISTKPPSVVQIFRLSVVGTKRFLGSILEFKIEEPGVNNFY